MYSKILIQKLCANPSAKLFKRNLINANYFLCILKINSRFSHILFDLSQDGLIGLTIFGAYVISGFKL